MYKRQDIYVGTDNRLAGRLCGEDLIERFPEGGKAVLLESSLFHSVAERMTGFEEAIANEGFEILERADTDGTREAAKAEMSRILSGQEEIDVIMCGNDEMALGALEAVREAGRSSIRIYGVDLSLIHI